jgi:hypothetical protein
MLIFKQILDRGISADILPGRTLFARDWYRDAATQIASNRVSPGRVQQSFDPKRKVSRLELGNMYMFVYDPKTKMDLPYYDTFPLIFPVETHSDGFLGINFHYLPLILRANLMNAIYSTTTDRKYDENTKVILTYSILKRASKYKAFKPTLKKYLNSHVRSPFLEITAKEWDIALFLPTERFRKSSKDTIWKESREKI